MITCTFEDGRTALLRHLTVGTIVEKDDKLLLVKRAEHLLEGGKWCMPGGYMSRDETLEECAGRETREETGYEVEIGELFFLNSNPNRPKEDRQNVDVWFLGKIKNKLTEPDSEVSDVQWFTISEMEGKDLAFDQPMILDWYKKYIQGSVKLPIVI